MQVPLPRFLASLIAPILVVGILPLWLIRNVLAAYDTSWPADSPWLWPARVVGAAVFLLGLALFVWCVSLFARRGRGTIMPWDPTQRLVVAGPYRHVRNPMISSVLFMVTGQALLWGSVLTAALAAFFFVVNHVYFIASEEPGLIKRFGDSYRAYKANVPRWLPRLWPYQKTSEIRRQPQGSNH
jgi:protein-S-isoprenylcysteine O-methyltransferase Ste14